MIKTVDNFNGTSSNDKTTKQLKAYNINGYSCEIVKNYKKQDFIINLKDYQDKSTNNTFFSFHKDEEKRNAKNADDLIISIKKDNDGNYLAQTGNYVGKFVWKGLEIDIKSRFSNIFLERMLNFANDIFLDDVSITGDSVDKNFDISKYIIYYMFVQNLEKAFLLGFPKAYKSIEHHEMKLKGKIDINRFIKNDIPFRGKVSSVSREQKENQEIIDVLYKAVKIIDKESEKSSTKENKVSFTKNISHIKTHLKQHRSNKYVSNDTINKAIKSKALQNPIFTPYKKVLEYAKFIIDGNNIEEKHDGKNETYGFIINVAELFEIYITKLLQNKFSDWIVESPKIELYPNQFFTRKIIPDIVMIKDNDVIIFDTKYKRMNMRGRDQNGAGDVDRNDFFQINTYMSFYQNKDYKVKVGGLLYPMNLFEIDECHSETWFGNANTKFIIDGINLSGNLEEESANKFSEISKREDEFIDRINNLLI